MRHVLEGTALDGSSSSVVLSEGAADEPVTLNGTRVEELALDGAFRTTRVRTNDGRSVGMVEHLFGALAGLSVRRGLEVRVTGASLPLLDGSARPFVALVAPREDLGRRVVRPGRIEIEGTRASFEPDARTIIEVEIDVPPSVERRASWRGDARDFVERIAPARTFAFERDIDAMLSAGLAASVDPASVSVVTERGVLGGAPDEPARHKLLDLLGDLYLWGGPFVGRVIFERPGHSTNHAVAREAIARGLVA